MNKEKNHSALTLPDAGLTGLPAELRQLVAGQWQDFCAASQEVAGRVLEDEEVALSLCRVWACSDFVAKASLRYPAMLLELIEEGQFRSCFDSAYYRKILSQQLKNVADDDDLSVLLRQFRRREMVRIAWRDIAEWADLDETLHDLSALARACVEVSLTCLHEWQSAELGMPMGEHSGKPQSMVVVGMGKLGADELNFSSDIDLIFTYPEEGETQGGRYELSNSEYFIRLGRRLIKALDQQTAEGFVFRVDMRLRPFGGAGPLAVSFDSMEQYCQAHGREWERYALIKADVIAGDRGAGAELMAVLRPFVYRRYIDFGVFESLREMKALITQQVRRKGMENNIKLGAGGIREIEFTGQAYQLLRGGREKGLQVRPIMEVLDYLEVHGHISSDAHQGLQTAYRFLRRAENRLQAAYDAQTHELPSDEQDQLRLACAMGFHHYDDFIVELREQMDFVHSNFLHTFAEPQHEQVVEQDFGFMGVWDGSMTTEAAQTLLAENGFENSVESLRLLGLLRESSRYLNMSQKGRERLDRLMPLLLSATANTATPSLTLSRLLLLLESVARRSAYLALLVENPQALSQLVRLCEASSWIAQHVARYPMLLDELLDPRSLYAPLDHNGLIDELRSVMEQADDDLEQQMDGLRHFKQTNVLRVAAADVSGIYPLMAVSNYLTEIAEVEVQQSLALAYQYLVEKYGRPECKRGGKVCEPGFMVIAYGKLGGAELGYGSDLDLVFLHGNYNAGGNTDGGASSVDNLVFFTRLGQRLIHILTAHTPAGTLYDVDSRLRPDGDKGILVSSMRGFANYQENEAWTWEHQALVRARVVVGTPGLAKRFAAVRRRVLSRQRDPGVLQEEVRSMRKRMRAHLDKSKRGRFDLKQGVGGIADIEFIVQYAVLRWSHQYPDLMTCTDNIHILGVLAAKELMTDVDARWLADAYRSYRQTGHRLNLQDRSGAIEVDGELEKYRREVIRIWRLYLEASPTSLLA